MTSRWKTLLSSLLALGLLYGNLAVVFHYRAHNNDIPTFLVPKAAYHTFLIFGVFSYSETSNQELSIWGLAQREEANQTYWKQLPTTDYFPFGHSEQNTRMWANMHFTTLGQDGHFRAWQALGRKILERHNREYLEDPITQVSFQSMSWPRDPAGFHARFSYTEGKKQFWIVAEQK